MITFEAPVIITSLVLLAVRLVLVVTFTAEARFKLKDMRGFVKADGIPISVAYAVTVAEAAAALAMLTGVLAQWAGVGIALLMLVTIGMHKFKWRSKYWANKGGWEYDLLMLVLAAVIAAFGAGSISLTSFL